MTARAAIGRQDGDYIELHNQWAKVCITFIDEYGGRPYYSVTGEPECSPQDFWSVTTALKEAWRVLALYQGGRF